MADISPNQWKLATIGLLIVGATVLITSLVIGRDAKVVPPDEMVQAQETDTQVAQKEPVSKPKAAVKIAAVPTPPKPVYAAPTPPQPVYRAQQPTHPSQSIVQACNKYASEQVNSKTQEVVTDALLGAAIGAAVGAAGGRWERSRYWSYSGWGRRNTLRTQRKPIERFTIPRSLFFLHAFERLLFLITLSPSP